MFEIRVLWKKYRNQKEVDKQSKFDSELIIVTINRLLFDKQIGPKSFWFSIDL